MALNQPVEETMSEVICYMLKRTNQVSTKNQLAIGQEYREWIKCIKNKNIVPQNIIFINTSTFGKKSQEE